MLQDLTVFNPEHHNISDVYLSTYLFGTNGFDMAITYCKCDYLTIQRNYMITSKSPNVSDMKILMDLTWTGTIRLKFNSVTIGLKFDHFVYCCLCWFCQQKICMLPSTAPLKISSKFMHSCNNHNAIYQHI